MGLLESLRGGVGGIKVAYVDAVDKLKLEQRAGVLEGQCVGCVEAETIEGVEEMCGEWSD